MSQITSHVLDTAEGRPASGIGVTLFQSDQDGWKQLSQETTNEDGRVLNLVAPSHSLEPGMYRIVFDTQSYFDQRGEQTFYPEVSVTFSIFDREHYHVPLLLSPFGYSTYRGS